MAMIGSVRFPTRPARIASLALNGPLTYIWVMTSPAKRRKLTAGRPRPLALGYCRVSTLEQADSRAGLDAQRSQLEAEAERQGWDLTIVADEGISGSKMTNRPALVDAIERVSSGAADVLLVTKVDRLARSMADSAPLIRRASAEGWQLVIMNVGDTGTMQGRALAGVFQVFSEIERDLISQRTREGLAAKRAQGVRLGRPSMYSADVVARVVAERAAGTTLQAIADGLTSDCVATAKGGAEWRVSSVVAILRGQDAGKISAG